MKDEDIERFFDNELKPARAMAAAFARLDAALNPETLLGNKPLPEIDLRGRNLDVRYQHLGPRLGWQCWDENSYDGAPDSDSNHIGRGPEREDALADLLEKLDEPPRRAGVPYAGNGNSEPIEYRPARYSDPDEPQ